MEPVFFCSVLIICSELGLHAALNLMELSSNLETSCQKRKGHQELQLIAVDSLRRFSTKSTKHGLLLLCLDCAYIFASALSETPSHAVPQHPDGDSGNGVLASNRTAWLVCLLQYKIACLLDTGMLLAQASLQLFVCAVCFLEIDLKFWLPM